MNSLFTPEPPPPQQRPAPRDIGWSLAALVLAALLPVLAFGAWTALSTIRLKESALEAELAASARGLQVAVDRVLSSQLAAMTVLATDGSLDQGDLATFEERARRVVRAHPDWRNAALIEPGTGLIVASVVPLLNPRTTTSAPADVAEVVRTRQPRVAGVIVRPKFVPQPLLLFLSPVMRDGQLRFVLAVSLDPAVLNRVFADQGLPATWTGAIIDSHLAVAGRSRDAERLLGAPVTPSLAERIRAGQAGMFTALNQEGAAVRTVFSRSPTTQWTVALGVPAAEVDAPIRQALREVALGGAALGAAALLLAGIVGRGIVARRRAHEQALNDELEQRRRIEAELRTSQHRLRDYTASAADWFWETDAQQRVTFLSDNYEACMGIVPQRILGRTRLELLAETGLNDAELIAQHGRVLERHEPFRGLEYRLHDSQGAARWASVSGVPVFDAAGSFTGYRGVGQDVSARHDAEDAAQMGHRLLREAVDNVASGFTIYDPEDRLVICNAAYLDAYATSRDLIEPGARFEDIVRAGAERGQYRAAQGDIDAWVAERVRLHQHPSGQPLEQELDDGRWLLIVETRTPSGYIVGNRIDITERKRAEAELRKLSRAVAQSPTSIFITDLDGRIEYVNQAFVDNTGYSRDEALGHNPRILKSGDTPPATYAAMWKALKSGQTWKGEFINRRRDGSRFVGAAIVSPIQESDGRVTHYVGIQDDVTERRAQAEELERHRHQLEALVSSRTAQLAEALDAAQTANTAKTQFLANMSHELRTPLNAILGLSHLVRNAGVEATQSERLLKIEGASRHLLEIISAILDLSKIEAGKLVLEQRALDVAAIVDSVVAMVKEDASAKGLDLRTRIDPPTPALLGDPMRLQQALLNYAANAVKFTEAGSVEIAVRWAAEADGAVRLRFEVSDTGIGIAEQHLPGLFTAFQQADNSATRRHSGTGLGLAITRRFAELMGGEVGVTSTAGVGSCFWFTARLQRLSAAQAQTAAPVPATLPGLAGRRVLLAEDNPINQEVSLALLDAMGLRVDLAHDGVEAVQCAERTHYDLVLMDMQMPRMGGLEATRRIRRLPGWAHTPILALTANAFVDDREECLAAGMDDFVSKPVDPATLEARLRHWLRPPAGRGA